MTHFPGERNTRDNLLAYEYTGKKSTDFRLPRGLEDGSQRWNWRHVRLVICTKLCSFVLQTLRCSVRSFYELYDALFVRSTNSTILCSFVLRTLRCSVRLLNQNERLFCTFDLQMNVVMTSTINVNTIVLRTDGSSTRVARTDLVFW